LFNNFVTYTKLNSSKSKNQTIKPIANFNLDTCITFVNSTNDLTSLLWAYDSNYQQNQNINNNNFFLNNNSLDLMSNLDLVFINSLSSNPKTLSTTPYFTQSSYSYTFFKGKVSFNNL
jgi:hypothetical protein